MQIIYQSNEMELVATASSVGEIEQEGYERVHVVLLDLHLPDAEGPDAIMRVKAKVPAVVVISATNDHRSVVDAIGAGANGFLTKGANAHEILKAVTTVAQGGAYVTPMLAAHLLRHAREADGSKASLLTDREREVLTLMAQGETDAAIANHLATDQITVRSLLNDIRDKTEQEYQADCFGYSREIDP